MKKLLCCIIILLWASVAAASNSTTSIGTTPNGDAVDGYFVGELVPDGNYSSCAVALLVQITQPYLLVVDGNYSASVVGAAALSYRSNSVDSIGTTPNGDAVDGAFVSAFTPATVVSITVAGGSVVLTTLAIESDGAVSESETGHIGLVLWDGVSWISVDWNNQLEKIRGSDVLPVIIINMD